MPAHLIAEEGPLRGLIIDFEKAGEWIIGRDPNQADFVLEDSTVSRKHVLCTKTEEGIYLKNLSTVNPCTVNDNEIKAPHLLKEGDTVRIGQNLFVFSEEQPKKIPPKKESDSAFDAIFEEDEGGELPPIGEIEETPLDEPIEEPVDEEPVEESAEKEEELSSEEENIPKEPILSDEDFIEEPPEEEEKTAYDTIFEDSEEYEDLPFNLIGETSLILKVIAGPNAGAEIGIQKGRDYIIGKDPNSSDIVFQDLSVSRNHAKLTVFEDGRIEIEDLGSKNGSLVNGIVIQKKTEITGQDLIALGTTTFLIIDREQEAETIYSPHPAHYETKKEEKEPEEKEEKEEAAEEWKKQVIPPKHLIVGGSFLVIFFVIFLSFFSLFKSQSYDIAGRGQEDVIKDALAKFPDVTYSYNPGSGKIFLVGHVLTPVDYQELHYRVDQMPFVESVEDNVIIDQLIWQSMNDVIAENIGLKSVSMHSPEAGTFVVTGYLQNPQQKEELTDYLNMNFTYVDRLQDNVAVESELNTQITSMLQAGGFSGVTMQLNNGSLTLAGRYDEKNKSQFESMLKSLRTIPGIRDVKNFAIPSTAQSARIDLSNNFQVTGFADFDDQSYSVVINGRVYTAGQSLQGLMITKVLPNTILLEKDDLKYKIDYSP